MSSSAPLIENPTADSLALLLQQFVVILASCRFLGWVLKKIRQPMEILAGVILGPSVCGYIPGFTNALFPATSLPVLNLFAQIGLIFFMFFLGMEVDAGLMKRAWRQSLPIAAVSIIIPFFCGVGLGPYVYSLDSTVGNYTNFLLFIGTGLAFTAFPVLARILASNGLMTQPIGILTLSCAAINDVMAWCTLAIVLSYSATGTVTNGIYSTLITIAFIVFMLGAVRPLLTRLHDHFLAKKDEHNRNFLALMFGLLCLSSYFAQLIGVQAFFGALLFGVCVPRGGQLIHHLSPKIELIIVEFFLPLYFVNSGLKTSLGSLNGKQWVGVLVVTLVAIAAKIVPVMLTTKLYGYSWRFSGVLGGLMNMRGLIGLIVLNIALSAKILTQNTFTIMVVMCLITTFMTVPVLDFFWMRHQPKTQQQQQGQAAADGAHAASAADAHGDHPAEQHALKEMKQSPSTERLSAIANPNGSGNSNNGSATNSAATTASSTPDNTVHAVHAPLDHHGVQINVTAPMLPGGAKASTQQPGDKPEGQERPASPYSLVDNDKSISVRRSLPFSPSGHFKVVNGQLVAFDDS